jgi:hypothetical protein
MVSTAGARVCRNVKFLFTVLAKGEARHGLFGALALFVFVVVRDELPILFILACKEELFCLLSCFR